MARVSKTAAVKVGDLLDTVANVISRNASSFGLDSVTAEKFAYQCDVLADHIAKVAGVDIQKLALTGDDVFDEGVLGFDPEGIGAEVDGPLEQDADESYMEGHFSQQTLRELREKQEAGEISDGSGSPEMQTPQAGIQASLQKGVKLATLYSEIASAAGVCASSTNPTVKQLGMRLASVSDGVRLFQARVLEGQESASRYNNLIKAAEYVRPHLASEISPAKAEKLAKMVDMLSGLTKTRTVG